MNYISSSRENLQADQTPRRIAVSREIHPPTLFNHLLTAPHHAIRVSSLLFSVKHPSHPVGNHHEYSPPRPPIQYHPLLTTPNNTSTTSSQNTLTLHPLSTQSPICDSYPTISFHISLPPSTYKLAQTHCRQTYTRSQSPKQTTYISHATISLKLVHLHYLRNTFHTACRTYIPEPNIYHYLHITCQLRIVHHNLQSPTP